MIRKEGLLMKIHEVEAELKELKAKQENAHQKHPERDDEYTKFIVQSEKILVNLKEKYENIKEEQESHHWDEFEQHVYTSFKSYQEAFTKSGSIYRHERKH